MHRRIFPNSSLCPDGMYASALIIAMARRQKLSQLVNNLPCYPLLRGSVADEGVVESDLERRLLAMAPSSVSRLDGIKLNFEDGWLLVRVSGTEPRIRITAEARSKLHHAEGLNR